MRAIVDNDILLKASLYDLLADVMNAVPNDGKVGILGAARFVVLRKIRKQIPQCLVSTVEARFCDFLAGNEELEPTEEEQELAASLEALAQKSSLNLDAGESQLVAILVLRGLPWLLTGDKRATTAIEKLHGREAGLSALTGKIVSLEQLIRKLLAATEMASIRSKICSMPDVDKTLTICFGCASAETSLAVVEEGLDSYIANLRSGAPRVLATQPCF